jgi:hypothetical protein
MKGDGRRAGGGREFREVKCTTVRERKTLQALTKKCEI